jgi:hypothetical protein
VLWEIACLWSFVFVLIVLSDVLIVITILGGFLIAPTVPSDLLVGLAVLTDNFDLLSDALNILE